MAEASQSESVRTNQRVHDPAFWAELAQHTWHRRRWRRTDGTPASERCWAYGTPIHRVGTYYIRPAYTDGTRWLCQQAYREMRRRMNAPHIKQ